jgi:cell fate regulator YaaT (PSP1 superfamily)
VPKSKAPLFTVTKLEGKENICSAAMLSLHSLKKKKKKATKFSYFPRNVSVHHLRIYSKCR